MSVKYEGNIIGSVMYVVFLIYPVVKDAFETFNNFNMENIPEFVLMSLVSLGLIGFLIWVLVDSSWMNYDDEEKETEWKTKRWLKFSVLFVLPAAKLSKSKLWKQSNKAEWGLEVAKQIQSLIMIFFGYMSLSANYKSHLSRLFQPFTIPRSKTYVDEKGQKFEANFIGSILTIVLILSPNWVAISESFGRILNYFFLNTNNTNPAISNSGSFTKTDPLSRAIADSVLLILFLYVFISMLISCIKVTYFLKQTKMNYLKFIPILLVPVAIIFSDHICTYGITKTDTSYWVKMLFWFLISLTAYMSLISPPDSIFAILFQPHVPMINIVSDLPNIKQSNRPRATAVFP